MSARPDIPIIAVIDEVRPQPRAWLLDIWGVLHNGVVPFTAAVAACERFRAAGGHVILVSNAPRPAEGVRAQLDQLGVPHAAYDAILTSGDVTRAALEGWGRVATLHIGPERDLTLFKGLAMRLVEATDAERILCSGLYDDTTETPDDYRELLRALVVRQIPMLCANPDIKVDRGGRIIYCGGAIAGLYAELGGPVDYAGKPHPPIYAAARKLLADLAGHTVASADILAIGDGVATDIAGGIAAGLRTVYVASAIHAAGALSARELERLFPDAGLRPHAAMQALA